MIQLASRTSYLLAAVAAVLTSLLLIWISLGVGIIGADGDPDNRYFFIVVLVGIIGAGIARFRAKGLAYTLFTMAAVQALIGVYAAAIGLGMPYSPPLEILGLSGFFVFLFVVSGWLFLRAAAAGRRT